MRPIFFVVAWLLLAAICLPCRAETPSPPQVLDARSHHLGLAGAPAEWKEWDSQPAEAEMLSLPFEGRANTRPATLFIRQRDVKRNWPVLLNGRKLGHLDLSEADLICALTIPPGVLREGENTLSILSPREVDDIFIEGIRLDSRPVEEALNEAGLRVQVLEEGGTLPLPCRITIVNSKGVLVPIFATPDQRLAVRPGVVYTGDGRVTLGLAAGDYTVFATRGFEYGVASRRISLAVGQSAHVELAIAHEVRLPGWAACDTHIHTFTNSHHGDATLEERALTLAGEGVEIAVATDHNFYTDLSEAARRMQVEDRFTPLIGDEVTTKAQGHLIAFPVARADAPLPDTQLTDWPALAASMRFISGVRVLVLNHPRDVYGEFIPFGPANFNPVTGELLHDPAFPFDAVEVANSGTLQSDFMQSYRDWFALLNHGDRVTAVGSSDSHDVARYIVGQGRSYVACDGRNPAHVDSDAVCRSFKEGRIAVSLGLFTDLRVDDHFGPGDLATALGAELHVRARILGPAWVRAEKVELFADGRKIREQTIATPETAGEKAIVEWRIPKPPHDVHLVAIASGPPVTAPYWPIHSPWMPHDRVRDPHVIGSTNPIWIDADGDGRYSSPRHYAEKLVQEFGTDPARLIPALRSYDEAVAAQVASLCQKAGGDIRGKAFTDALRAGASPTQAGFAEFIQTLARP